jgi:hypothetical protein
MDKQSRRREWASPDDFPLQERLHVLSSFVPEMEAPGFQFGAWEGGGPSAEDENVRIWPYFAMGPVASRFFHACYEFGWVKRLDWITWMNSPEGRRFFDDPAAIDSATADELANVLTVLLRHDRFVEGGLNSTFESGFLLRILRRAAALEGELK